MANDSLWARSYLLWAYICVKLRVVLTFLNGFPISKEEQCLMTCENYIKFKFVSINEAVLAHSHTHYVSPVAAFSVECET